MQRLAKLQKASSKLTILYIEDDQKLQTKTKALFDSFFKRVDIADDGQKGIKQYETYYYETKTYYDIVVTDLRMPNLDGLSVVKNIMTQNKDQKIIVTSAFGEKDNLIEFINLGISKFLPKPFISDQLINVLYDVIGDLIDNDQENLFYFSHDLYWNRFLKKLVYQERPIKLSHNETIILNTIVNYPQKIFSQFDLYNLIVVESEDRDFSQDSLKSIIKRLRQKLPYDVIQNIYGQGYSLQLIS